MKKNLLRRSANSSMVEPRTVSGTIVDALIVIVLIGVMIAAAVITANAQLPFFVAVWRVCLLLCHSVTHP